MRDPDGWTYFKEEVGGLVVGGFEPEAKPWVAPGRSRTRSSSSCSRRTGSTSRCSWTRRCERVPALERDRDPQVLQRSRVLHAGQPVPARRGARAGRLLRRRRLQLGRHRLGRAAPGGRWPSGSSRGSRRGTCRRSTSAASRRSTPTTTWLRDRVAEVLGLHYAMPWPNREPETARDVRLLAAARAAGRRRARCSAPGWAGSGRLYFGAGAGWTTPGASRPGCVDAPPSRAPAARRSRSSTRRRSRKYAVHGPDALGALQWVCAADVDVAGRRRVYTPCSTRAAPTRPT